MLVIFFSKQGQLHRPTEDERRLGDASRRPRAAGLVGSDCRVNTLELAKKFLVAAAHRRDVRAVVSVETILAGLCHGVKIVSVVRFLL